jgi:hypothetical protein
MKLRLWAELSSYRIAAEWKKEKGGHLDKNFMLRVSIFENKK